MKFKINSEVLNKTNKKTKYFSLNISNILFLYLQNDYIIIFNNR